MTSIFIYRTFYKDNLSHTAVVTFIMQNTYIINADVLRVPVYLSFYKRFNGLIRILVCSSIYLNHLFRTLQIVVLSHPIEPK